MHRFLILFAIFIFSFLFSNENEKLLHLEKYLLPPKHPIKHSLDKIFTNDKVLASVFNLQNAGFIDPKIRKRNLVIGKHKSLKGYLLKMYLENTQIDELIKFATRIEGAWLIQKYISESGYDKLFKVPKKWIYKLPKVTAKEEGNFPKQYILVVEDMRIFDILVNAKLFKTSITTSHLDALFDIILKLGLSESMNINNIPFSKNGYVSFVDTEVYGRFDLTKLNMHKLAKFLSEENVIYWRNLCNE